MLLTQNPALIKHIYRQLPKIHPPVSHPFIAPPSPKTIESPHIFIMDELCRAFSNILTISVIVALFFIISTAEKSKSKSCFCSKEITTIISILLR